MKLEKAEKILRNFIEQRECPANVKQAVQCFLDHELREFHRLNFARNYLHGMTSLSPEDVEVLKQGVT